MAAMNARVLAERFLLGGGFVVLFLAMPHGLRGDDLARYSDLRQVLDHGHVTDSRYSLLMPLASAPFVLLGDVIRSPTWWAARFDLVVVAVGALVVWLLARGRVESGLLRRTLLLLLFASLFTERLRAYSPEVFSATLIAIGLVCTATRSYVAAGWVAIAIGAANTPVLVPALVPLACYEAVRTKRWRPFLCPALAVALVGAEAWIRRGSPFDTGYGGDHGLATVLPYSGRPGFSYPFLLGVASLVLSFGRGLVFFAPGLLLWLGVRTRRAAGALRPLVVAMLLLVGAMVLVYAKWWSWYGGLTWGPRFFAFAALPASLLIALRLRRVGDSVLGDLGVFAVLALSAWVGVVGATADYSEFGACAQHGYALESLCWYVPEYSSLWWPILHRPAVTFRLALVVVWCAAVFVCLAAPLVRALASSLSRPASLRAWAHGWRF
jgi:hypothetical protein